MKKDEKSNIINYNLEINFSVQKYMECGDFRQEQIDWVKHLYISGYRFHTFHDADYQLELLKTVSEKLNVTEDIIVKASLANDILDLRTLTQQHVDRYLQLKNNIALVPKDFFLGKPSSPIVWLSALQMKQLKSAEAIKEYLYILAAENPKQFDLCAEEILRMGMWLIENKNFNFSCANHFAATARKLIEAVENSGQTPKEIVDYNIKYNKSFKIVAPVGSLDKKRS